MTTLGELVSVLSVARSGRLLAVRSFARQAQDKPGRPVSRTVETHIAAVLACQPPCRRQAKPPATPGQTSGIERVEQVIALRGGRADAVVFHHKVQSLGRRGCQANAGPAAWRRCFNGVSEQTFQGGPE